MDVESIARSKKASILFYSILFYSILFYSCALRVFSKSGQNIFSQSKDACRRGFGHGGIMSRLPVEVIYE